MTILGLTFTAPALLFGLLALPVIWWLLRFTPPRPKVVAFPPTRILHKIRQRDETAATSPWWLTLLRLCIAALLIAALSNPVIDPDPIPVNGEGPAVIVVDNGWPAASGWEQRRSMMREIIEAAERQDRTVILAPTADEANVAGPVPPERAEALAEALAPRPYAPQRAAILQPLRDALQTAGNTGEIFWLSDGIDHGGVAGFVAGLGNLMPDAMIHVFAPGANGLPIALGEPRNEAGALTLALSRPAGTVNGSGTVAAHDEQGRRIAEAPFSFEGGELTATAAFDVPVELRNDFVKLSIDGEETAGAVQLLDSRWRRRAVGLLSGESGDIAQPLLSPLHYLEQALAPFTELRISPDRNISTALDAYLQRGVSALVLADIGTLPNETADDLERWIEAGGVLIRFAGPRLAASDDGRLVPVRLRRGGRTLGGTLSWSEPRQIDAFQPGSPFFGIEIDPETIITRQVLAEPAIDLGEKTWARIDDGTPLVTAEQRGAGWLILFHVTADTRWSNLVLSGTFVEMVRRLSDLGGAAPTLAANADPGGGATAPKLARGTGFSANPELVALSPRQTLDGFGNLSAPPPTARPMAADAVATTLPDATHPPGFYGPAKAPVALNLFQGVPELRVIENWGTANAPSSYPDVRPIDLTPYLFMAALILLLVDGLAMVWLAGRLPALGGARTAGAIVILAIAVTASPAQAQQQVDDSFAMLAANETRLAYVVTGNSEIDRISEAGLRGLTAVLTARTALEPGEPMGVDPRRDELAFFPILYWPIDPGVDVDTDTQTLARIDAFMKQGGTILFDTRDALQSNFGVDVGTASPATVRLRELLSGLDIPALEPVPPDHVLTKAFYLLQTFPGRYDAGRLWVEATATEDEEEVRPARAGDGVSSILISANDLAGAWAIDDTGRPLLPIGSGAPGQREIAYRVGVNIVMYTLTGNYKADQVHIPALLERLGQ